MYDSFDNMYQATIGIDFLSKVRTPGLLDSAHDTTNPYGPRPCTWRTEQCGFSCGILLAKSVSEV